MNKARLITLLLALGPCAADAGVIYDFSFDNVLGSVAGTIQGTIELDFLASSSGSGTGSASSIEILSTPAGTPASAEGMVVTSWATQGPNTFTVVDGVITGYQFGASEGATSTLEDNVMCLNSGGFFNLPGAYICGAGENFFGNADDFTYNTDGIQAVDFTVASVPEPGSLMLLALGLVGLGISRCGKKA